MPASRAADIKNLTTTTTPTTAPNTEKIQDVDKLNVLMYYYVV